MESFDISYITVADIIENTVAVTDSFSLSLDFVVLEWLENSYQSLLTRNEILEEYIRTTLHQIPPRVQENVPDRFDSIPLLLFYRSQVNEPDELQLFKRILLGQISLPAEAQNVAKSVTFCRPAIKVYYNLYEHDVTEGTVQESLLELPAKRRYSSNVVTFIVIGDKNVKQIKSYPRYFVNEVELKLVSYFGCQFLVVLECDQVLCSYCTYEVASD